MIVPLVCTTKAHAIPLVLGAVELPDDATPLDVFAATRGYLCEDCGAAYVELVSTDDTFLPGQVPTVAQVAAYKRRTPTKGHPA